MKPVVRTHRPANQLAAAVQTRGGVTIAEALQHATENVETLRADYMAVLDEKIAAIEAFTRSVGFSGDAETIRKVYALANEVLNEAGAFGLAELSAAGRSLCDLTAARADSESLDLRAIRVHVEAMKSLRRPEVNGDAQIRAAVLEGLRQVTAKMGVKPTSGPTR
ncbi:MAG: hypothetical protein JNJ73_12495 [Hyphomonadaceae bacterium]|nr:hypothetical protein [Hyphomonadaceae bacterium]